MLDPKTGDCMAGLERLRPGSAPTPLPIEHAAFLRFDLSRVGRRLAAVVGMPDQEELRIYELRGGILYLQNPEQADARFLRFMPIFVARVKTAVDEANR